MKKRMQDWQMVYHTLTGNFRFNGGVPWVENIFTVGTEYDYAHQKIWDVCENLGERLKVEWESDEDLEKIMQTVLELEQIVGKYMFHYGIEYANRGNKL